MSDVVTAYLRQDAPGTWNLWVSTGREGLNLSTALPTTAPGVVPAHADRTAALVRLGYEPASQQSYRSGWGWEEVDLHTVGLGLALVGQVAVRPAGSREAS